jgi:hypothetical protein
MILLNNNTILNYMQGQLVFRIDNDKYPPARRACFLLFSVLLAL